MRRVERLMTFNLLSLIGLISAMACESPPFDQPLALGGVTVTADELNRGYTTYRRYCVGCHGFQGDGRGGATAGMLPPPRDFTKGQYKFTSVCNGALPRDEDLMRTVRHGLRGTHMNGFERLPETDVHAVVQYIKTLAPRWRKERPGPALSIPADPWDLGQRMAAVARGRIVYHGMARCWQCHPAYANRDEIVSMAQTVAVERGQAGAQPLPWRQGLEQPTEVETIFGTEHAPDFRHHQFRMGSDLQTLYRTIGTGVGGTPMPSWSTKLTPRDLWALVHYVLEVRRKAETL